MVTAKTNLTGIGTVPFMAPEVLPGGCLRNQVCLDDLFKVDCWGFGMTLFSLLHPDLKYSFKLDHQTGSAVARFETFIVGRLNKGKNFSAISNKFIGVNLVATIVNLEERTDVNILISSNQQRLEYHS